MTPRPPMTILRATIMIIALVIAASLLLFAAQEYDPTNGDPNSPIPVGAWNLMVVVVAATLAGFFVVVAVLMWFWHIKWFRYTMFAFGALLAVAGLQFLSFIF